MEEDDDDIPVLKGPSKRKARIVESSDEEEGPVAPPKKKQATSPVTSKSRATTSIAKPEPKPVPRKPPSPRKAATSTSSRKTKPKDDDFIASSEEADDDDDFEMDDEEEVVKKGKSRSRAPAKKTPAKSAPAKSTPKAAKAKAEETKSTKAEEKKPAKAEDKANGPPTKKPKFVHSHLSLEQWLTRVRRSWYAAKAARVGPSNPGSKEIPIPDDPNCLAGLSFVFTGELSSLSRDEAIELAKRYGGCVRYIYLFFTFPTLFSSVGLSESHLRKRPLSSLVRTRARASSRKSRKITSRRSTKTAF